ncbi:hypothetical protein [Microvirga aerophila]|uniref:hypothetical protein n=1 Tax=Microvirga aerophila TaxID=670291 RepID=UPI000DEF1D4D|nr:hypothetical protein [Microvirga aerophila]
MGYEVAVGPLLVAVIALIAFMTVLYWFVSYRFREVIIGFIVAGMVLEQRWLGLSEQRFRFAKWSLCRG